MWERQRMPWPRRRMLLFWCRNDNVCHDHDEVCCGFDVALIWEWQHMPWPWRTLWLRCGNGNICHNYDVVCYDHDVAMLWEWKSTILCHCQDVVYCDHDVAMLWEQQCMPWPRHYTINDLVGGRYSSIATRRIRYSPRPPAEVNNICWGLLYCYIYWTQGH